jgi:hypothetical protein
MIPDGLYRIYKMRFDEAKQKHVRLVGRIMIHERTLHHLEDHGQIHELLPEGEITAVTARRWGQLQNSGYYQVVDENDLHAGEHPEHVEDLDLGEIKAEAKFIMTGDGLAKPSLVELWDHAVMVDGHRLDDSEAQQLLHEVQAGRVVLTPVE